MFKRRCGSAYVISVCVVVLYSVSLVCADALSPSILASDCAHKHIPSDRSLFSREQLLQSLAEYDECVSSYAQASDAPPRVEASDTIINEAKHMLGTQEDALLDLYVSTNGEHWLPECQWNISTPACERFGVECRNASIRAVRLEGCNLTGILPTGAFLGIEKLQDIHLRANSISGPLPLIWSSSFTRLVTLDLGFNNITGHVNYTGYAGFLDLSHNHIESIYVRGALVMLDASHNEVRTFNVKLGDDTPSLQTLTLSNNPLSGSLDTLCNGRRPSHSLLYLSVSDTMITKLPCSSALQSLKLLDVRNCTLLEYLPGCVNDVDKWGRKTPSYEIFMANGAELLRVCDEIEDEVHIHQLKPQNQVYQHYTDTHLGFSAGFLTYKDLEVPRNRGRDYACPYMVTAPGVPALVEPVMYEYAACACMPGFYGTPPMCSPCPIGANCSSYGTICPAAESGYYGDYAPATSAWHCGVDSAHFLPCDLVGYQKTACVASGGFRENKCSAGYTDRLCSLCAEGYHHHGSVCVTCGKGNVFGLLSIVSLVVCLLALFIYVWLRPLGSETPELSILFSFMQVFAQRFMMRFPLPAASSDIMQILAAVMHPFALDLAGTECLGSTVGGQLGLIFGSTFFLLVLFGSLSLVIRIKNLPNRDKWRYKLANSSYFLLSSLYVPVMLWVLRSLICKGGHLQWVPWVSCLGLWTVPAWCLLIVYGIGFPVLFAILLYKDHNTYSLVYLIAAPYKENLWWWELVNQVRKVVFILAVAFSGYSSSSLYLPLILVVFGMSGVISMKVQPYTRPLDNTFEAISLCVNALLMSWSSVFFQPDLPDMFWSLTFLMLLGYAWCGVCVAYVVYMKRHAQSYSNTRADARAARMVMFSATPYSAMN